VTALLLLVSEVTPKMFAATHAELVAFAMVRPLWVLMRLLYPIAAFFAWAGRLLLRLVRIPTKRRSPLVTEEEIKVMIQMGREAGVLAEEELRMLQRIFEFSDSVVSEVMVPRGEIAGVDLNRAKAEDVLDVLIEEGHARIPVYRGSLDQVEGVIYARDVLATVRHGGLFALADLIRPIAVVPGSKRIAELLSEFQRDKVQIAIVQDGEGRTAGLVTIEDLLEEIVGEIHEEGPRRRPSTDARDSPERAKRVEGRPGVDIGQ
jgi:CBS domain containing-hemolysin-like protein